MMNNNATLAEMSNFVRVVETRSITAAADSQDTVKSAVSKRLSDLEKALGVELIRRSTRKLHLTDAGRSYYQRCVQILAEIDELNESIRGDELVLRGRLKVTAPMSFGLRHLQPIVIEFAKQHPMLQLDLIFSDRVVDIVQEGVDLAIRVGELQDSSLIAKRLFPIHQVICASRDYLQQHGEPETPEDLKKHKCLVFSDTAEPTIWKCRAPDNRNIRIDVPPAMLADSGEVLLSATCAGMGINKAPTFVAHKAREEGKVVPILNDYSWSTTQAYAVYPSTRHLANRVRAFIDFVNAKFNETPYWNEF